MGRLKQNTNGLATVYVDELGSATVEFTDLTTGGVVSVNDYDDRGNLLLSRTGFTNDLVENQRTTVYEYDKKDQLISVTDPEGFTTRFQYDAFGNKVSIVTGLYELGELDAGYDDQKALRERPQRTLFEYDSANNITKTISGEGNVVETFYDVFSNQRSVTVGITLRESQTVGNVTIQASDDAEHISETRYTYDKAGRLKTKVTGNPADPDVLGVSVEITRDKLGRQSLVRTLQDARTDRWSETRTEYDSFGRVVVETDALGFETRYSYDAFGNQSFVIRDKNEAGDGAIVTQFLYDKMNRLGTEIDAEGNPTTYSYDKVGNLVEVENAEGGRELLYYDAYSQLIASVSPLGALTTYERDAYGNATGLRCMEFSSRIQRWTRCPIPKNPALTESQPPGLTATTRKWRKPKPTALATFINGIRLVCCFSRPRRRQQMRLGEHARPT